MELQVFSRLAVCAQIVQVQGTHTVNMTRHPQQASIIGSSEAITGSLTDGHATGGVVLPNGKHWV